MGRQRWVHLAVTVEATVLAYGGAVHVVQLATGGWPPYQWAPPWLALYFTALTILDPLTAALLLTRRTIGLYLAAAVLITDAAANGYATYFLLEPTVAGRLAQAVISVLAVASVVLIPYARPWFASSPPSRNASRASSKS